MSIKYKHYKELTLTIPTYCNITRNRNIIITMYEKIYKIVKQIPYGHVASYGQISSLICGCTPRLVGYALSSCPDEYNIPWHRVINAQGKISLRRNGSDEITQREMLESEGIKFDINNIVSFNSYGYLPL